MTNNTSYRFQPKTQLIISRRLGTCCDCKCQKWGLGIWKLNFKKKSSRLLSHCFSVSQRLPILTPIKHGLTRTGRGFRKTAGKPRHLILSSIRNIKVSPNLTTHKPKHDRSKKIIVACTHTGPAWVKDFLYWRQTNMDLNIPDVDSGKQPENRDTW